MMINGFGPASSNCDSGERIAVAVTAAASIAAAAFSAPVATIGGITPNELIPASTKKPTTNHGTPGPLAAPSPLGRHIATTASTGASKATRVSLTIAAMPPAPSE